MRREIEIRWPFGGLDRSRVIQDQPEFTFLNGENVAPVDGLSGKTGGARRLGIRWAMLNLEPTGGTTQAIAPISIHYQDGNSDKKVVADDVFSDEQFHVRYSPRPGEQLPKLDTFTRTVYGDQPGVPYSARRSFADWVQSWSENEENYRIHAAIEIVPWRGELPYDDSPDDPQSYWEIFIGRCRAVFWAGSIDRGTGDFLLASKIITPGGTSAVRQDGVNLSRNPILSFILWTTGQLYSGFHHIPEPFVTQDVGPIEEIRTCGFGFRMAPGAVRPVVSRFIVSSILYDGRRPPGDSAASRRRRFVAVFNGKPYLHSDPEGYFHSVLFRVDPGNQDTFNLNQPLAWVSRGREAIFADYGHVAMEVRGAVRGDEGIGVYFDDESYAENGGIFDKNGGRRIAWAGPGAELIATDGSGKRWKIAGWEWAPDRKKYVWTLEGSQTDENVRTYRLSFAVAGPRVVRLSPEGRESAIMTYYTAAENKGLVPAGCPAIALFRDAVFLAGYPERAWYRSREGDIYDWDYGASENDPHRAVAGAAAFLSRSGMPGSLPNQPITGLVALSSDYLLMGCESALYLLSGNAALNGFLPISNVAGMVSQNSWCIDSEGNVWLLGYNGLYLIRYGRWNVVEPVSARRLPREMIGVRREESYVTLAWDPDEEVVRVFITPKDPQLPARAWFYHVPSQSFWPATLGARSAVTCCSVYPAMDSFFRETILYGVRPAAQFQMALSAIDRQGIHSDFNHYSTVDSYIDIGPISIAGSPELEGVLCAIRGVLAQHSADVIWELRAGRSALEALNSRVIAGGRWTAGVNHLAWPEVRGQSVFLRIRQVDREQPNSGFWSVEKITAIIETAGGRMRV